MRPPRVCWVVLGVVLLALPQGSFADQVSPSGARDERAEIGPFVPGAIGVEFGAGGLGELVTLNEHREWLADGTGAVWWAFREGRSLVVEFHVTEVFQHTVRNAFVNGIMPAIRWRVLEGRVVDVFAETGVGVSWSDTRVPVRGTTFNYLAEAGVGIARRVGRQTHAVAGVRAFHLSNGGREGLGRNPDIEALGGYVGLNVGF